MKKKFIAGILFAASLSLGAGAWRQSARADDQNGYNADIPQMEGQSIEDEADDLYRSSLPQKIFRKLKIRAHMVHAGLLSWLHLQR